MSVFYQGYAAPNLFLYACYVSTSIQKKGPYVKFSSKEIIGSECFLTAKC